MANNYRVTFFFETQQRAIQGSGVSLGWTESWYKTSADTLQTVITDLDILTYIALRTAFMPALYRISFVRVNDEDNPRRFKIRGIGPEGQGKVVLSTTDLPIQVQCAILVDLERMPLEAAEKAHHRRFLVRGLPNEVVNGNVLEPFGPMWRHIRKFLDFVGNEDISVKRTEGVGRFTWGIKYRNPTATKHIISQAQPQMADAQRLLVTAAGMGDFLPGTRATVQGIKSPRNFNKTWLVTGTTTIGAETFLVLERSRERLQGEYSGPGTGVIIPAVFLYGQVDQYVIIGLRVKKTGRSFHLLRGRQSRR